MEYKLSFEEFCNGKMCKKQIYDDRTEYKIHHTTGNRIKIFPYVGNKQYESISDFSILIGDLLCNISGMQLVDINKKLIIDKLDETNLVNCSKEQKEKLKTIVEQYFFDSNDKLRPINLKLLSMYNDSNSKKHLLDSETGKKKYISKVVDYISDVLADKNELKIILNDAIEEESKSYTVLESLICELFKSDEQVEQEKDNQSFFKVINYFDDYFQNDFKYILKNRNRVKECLVPLIELYYLSYTMQTGLQLDKFFKGSREEIIPVYFCFDWEKTSQNRLCYSHGWFRVYPILKKIFSHASTLEILNHTEGNSCNMDYIAIKKYIEMNLDKEEYVISEIKKIKDLYRSSIRECSNYNCDEDSNSNIEKSIIDLFKNIDYQFNANNDRKNIYIKYFEQFDGFCQRFLKNRGRSGKMLTLSEENIILLTRLIIQDKEKVLLKEIFNGFEKRGFYFDDLSKDELVKYYEKLNLVEKKSDSGDAKYVRQIL